MNPDTKQFLAALTLAALYSRKPFLNLALAGMKATILYPLSPKADEETATLRHLHCQQCSVFYSPTRTCGSPLADDPDKGCWCHTKRLAKLKNGHCWLNEQGQTGGWRI